MAYDLTEDEIIGQIIDGSITELTNTAATSIADNILGACTNLTSITFENATSVGESPFASCTALTDVNLPNCESVGKNCFVSCSALTAISLPKLKKLTEYTFNGCNALASLSLPVCEVVESQGLYSSSALTEVNLPACTEVKDWGFQNVGDLVTTFNLPLCETIGERAFYYAESLTSITLPKCKTLGTYVFQGCSNLASVDAPVCETIAECAFAQLSGLTYVSIPACKKISTQAFMSCSKLEEVVMTAVESVETLAFGWDSALRTASLPNCKSIASAAFMSCTALESMALPLCESLGDSVFQGCSSLSSVSVPKVKTVGSGAFVNCSALPTISFSSCILSIVDGAFYGTTALTDIYIDRLEGYVVGASWGATAAMVHWKQPEDAPIPSTTPYQSFNIALASKTLSDTFSGVSVSCPELKSNVEGNVKGLIFNFTVAGYTHSKNTGLYAVRGNYDINKLLGQDYSTSGLSVDANASRIFSDLIGDMGKGPAACFSNFIPTGIKYADNNSYSAIETFGSVIQKLFGWTDIVPTTLVNVFERSGIIYAVERGKEPNESIEITPAEIDYMTYSESYRRMDILFDSSKDYYITGDISDVADSTTEVTSPAVYLSGQYTDNSGQQTLNYSYGLLKSENFNSTDGTVVSSTTYDYSKVYPPANLVSKKLKRTETKNNSDIPSPSDITSFPYKVTETIVNNSTLLNSMAVNGVDLIQATEATSCVKRGYSIIDKNGTQEPWMETDEHETITYYSDMGQGQWSVTVYKDGIFVNSQVVTGNPGALASPYAIKENSTYQSRRGGRVKAKMAKLSGRFNGNMSLNVSDQDTVNRIRDAIEDLNGKTEESISFSYLGSRILDFMSTITYKGNIYYLESNNISVKTDGTRQQITMVRWY